VGTELATAGGEGGGALGGVYKLVRYHGEPRLKVTQDIAKATLPDRKKLLRLVDEGGNFLQDVICREGEKLEPGTTVYDPTNPSRHKKLAARIRSEDVRSLVMDDGEIVIALPDLESCAERCADQLQRLPDGTLRLYNPHLYKVSISPGLHDLREQLMARYES
jgi:nicotinate phosphoribosyltransferase